MKGRGPIRNAAQLLGAAALTWVAVSPGNAQSSAAPASDDRSASSQEPAATSASGIEPLDPSAPLDALPDLGVDWPDLNAPDQDAPLSAVPEDGIEESSNALRYSYSITGLEGVVDPLEIEEAFAKSSALREGEGKGANAAQIGRRSQADSDLLAELLRSRGYYDALVTPEVKGSGDMIAVSLGVEPGPLYRFTSVSLPGIEAAPAEDVAKLEQAFGVAEGDPVNAEEVIAGTTELSRKLGELGFAGASLGARVITIDHENHQARLVQPVDPGPIATFGTMTVTGKPPFDAKHVNVIARFREGDQFRQSRLDDLRRALIATGLVANAVITTIPRDGGRVVDVAVKLEPAPARTIAGEVGYGTGQGARAEVSWTNRNFFNPEGALTLRGVLGTSEQLAGIQLRRNNFRRRDQVLNAQLLASHQKFAAYEAKTVLLSGNIERQSNFIWQKKWTFVAGASLLATDERGVFSPLDTKTTRTFLIAALPGSLGYDGSDNLLNPTRGFRLRGMLSPELSAHSGQMIYALTQVDASAYQPVGDQVVLAGRVRLGSILGASIYDIAPSRRFYAGGGGSVRGYGYQQLGPKDVDNDPIGGRGLAEFSLESRIRLNRFGGNFGIVPFLDAGNLSESARPGSGTWRFAAGLGLRYYSSFGPIRIDVGFPLNREKGDGRFAVAVALGQAF